MISLSRSSVKIIALVGLFGMVHPHANALNKYEDDYTQWDIRKSAAVGYHDALSEGYLVPARLKPRKTESKREIQQILNLRQEDARAVARANEDLRARKAKQEHREMEFEFEKSQSVRELDLKRAELDRLISEYNSRLRTTEKSLASVEDRRRALDEQELETRADVQKCRISLVDKNSEIGKLQETVSKLQTRLLERETELERKSLMIQQLQSTVNERNTSAIKPTNPPSPCEVRLIKCERKIFR
jgi:chromosome segregation ATPase